MHFKRLIATTALAIGALAITAPSQAANYKSEYKLSIVVGTTFPWGQGAVIWSDLVRQRTNGRINIKVYPGTSLVQGDQTREFTAIRQGVI
ncbi:MAG TPA: C4-dicarboxylate ABC transporter, partial [Castellaniella sp.]